MSPWKKIALSVFILFHLGACAAWLLPDSYIETGARPLIKPYIFGMGMWQAWNMFSPDPTNLMLYIYGRVFHSDGTFREVWLPQLHNMGPVECYGKYRFSMYVQSAHYDSSEALWPDLARWIASEDHKVTGKPAMRVRLYRIWWLIPSPPEDTSITPIPQWTTYRFFELKIKDASNQKHPVKHVPDTMIARH